MPTLPNMPTATIGDSPNPVTIPSGNVLLDGDLLIPAGAAGLVVFVHGSGSSRHSPRNRFVARVIRDAGMGTLLFDLLTKDEEAEDNLTGRLRFDIGFLTQRLLDVIRWLRLQPDTSSLPVGFFGASTGAAAALAAAAEPGTGVRAVVSRGGRPDLAGGALSAVTVPTLLIVGGFDDRVISLNGRALSQLRCQKQMHIVPGASHLFEEPGTLEQVAQLSAQWFHRHLASRDESSGPD